MGKYKESKQKLEIRNVVTSVKITFDLLLQGRVNQQAWKGNRNFKDWIANIKKYKNQNLLSNSYVKITKRI